MSNCSTKLIELGWDTPDTAWLREHVRVTEQRPFDGIVIHAVGKDDEGRGVSLLQACSPERWQRAWFRQCVDDLRACEFERFTDNFIRVGAMPGGVDWFDEAGWGHVTEHFGAAAWLAAETGCRGICFDPEPYTRPHFQFRYGAQAGRGKHSFEAYSAKARERGRQVMTAMAGEFPDLVFFALFLNSVNAVAARSADPAQALQTMSFNLLPAFLDGMLDVAPPTVTFVDGCERAYLFRSSEQYVNEVLAVRTACRELVSVENRDVYNARVQVGFGVFLDAYWNPAGSEWDYWYVDGNGMSRPDRFRANLLAAARVSDRYVWVYGEKFRWWPAANRNVRAQAWPDALPGSEDALRMARDPVGYARAKIAALQQEGKLVNLVREAHFELRDSPCDDAPAEDWAIKGVSQEVGGAGRPEVDQDGALVLPAGSGCFAHMQDVRPGEVYAVSVAAMVEEDGIATLRVRWQSAQGRWMASGHDVLIPSRAAPGQWSELCGIAVVPEGAAVLATLLSAPGQSSPDHVARFRTPLVVRLL